MKDLKAVSTSKNQIKKWIPKDCPCRLCNICCTSRPFVEASEIVCVL